MAASIQISGDIECICQGAAGLKMGDTAPLVFRLLEDASPPFTVKVRDPDGKTILDRVIRELPTGRPQSAAPLQFPLRVNGAYAISIKELYGKKEGNATLTVK